MDIFIKILQIILIKAKNGYFHKHLTNNLDEREIKFHVFDNFLRLMPVKSESLKISLHKLCSSILFLCNTTFLLFWNHTE